MSGVDGGAVLAAIEAPPGVALYAIRYELEAEADDAALAALSPVERKRASGFARRQDRARFVQTRLSLRRLLGGRLQCAPPDVPIVFGAHEKPELAPPRRLHFNIAHSRARGLIAIAEVPVGVDVEWINLETDWPPLAARVLHPDERAVLEGLTGADATRGFFTHWARKEAVLKALGTGFYTESRSFPVPQGAVTIDAPPSGGLPGPPARLHVWSVDVDPDYAAAVATMERLA